MEGIRNLEGGNLDLAEKAFLRSLELLPDRPSTLQNLAVVYHQKGDTSKAAQTLLKVLELEPANAEARVQHAILMRQTGDVGQALESLDKAIEIAPSSEIYVLKGNFLADVGMYEASIVSYDAAIRHDPRNAIAWCNKGTVLNDNLNKPEEAISNYARAIDIRPDYTDAHYNLGVALGRLGRDEDALASYDNVIELKSDYAEAWSNRGNALNALKRREEALASYDKALMFNRDYVEAWFNRANVLNDLDRHEEAVASYDKAVELKPDYAEAWSNRGNALNNLQRHEDAIASYDKALALKNDYAGAWLNRGSALEALKRHEEAIASYDKAIELKRDYAEAWSNRGNALNELQRYEDALASYDRALSIKPDYAEAWFNRGNALKDSKRYDEALANYDHAIRLKPDYAQAWFNRGVVLDKLKRHEEALRFYDKAVELKHDFAEAQWNRSLSLLCLGNLKKGLELYEWRWKQSDSARHPGERFAQPLWLGTESLKGRTVLLASEQGLGDTIHFCRYAPLVASLGAKVILEAQPALIDLLKTCEGIDNVIARGEPLPPFDYYTPLLSLPLAFKTELSTIPASIPYLRSAPVKVAQWRARLGAKTKPRLGVVWSSVSEFKDDANRSVSLASFLKAIPPGRFELICLQKLIKDEDSERLAATPELKFYGDEFYDFTDTAAVIENVDLVVSTCTSVPHLSGAMGKPTWIMLSYLPDWRWFLDRDDSPWYPTAKLYRQPGPGDWDSVFKRVRADLEAFATEQTPSASSVLK
ncbi:MAG: tetratricopeptide repeat protein [Rhodospirillaceae bacterium]